MKGIIDLSIGQMAWAYVFALLVLVLIRYRGINREREILVSCLRMTLQLILVGYILVYILDNPNPIITVGIIVVMEIFAIYTVFNRFSGQLSPRLQQVVVLAMSVGTLSCIFYFLLVVVRMSPWYNPQYFVPIGGMIIGNSMTGISLGIKSLLDGMSMQRNLVEEALILGATPQTATGSIVNSSFDAAIMPTINSMLGMGIVFLPGMMTGQILSGTSPTTAITYQIAIMLCILGAVAISVMLMLHLGSRTFFNQESQLI